MASLQWVFMVIGVGSMFYLFMRALGYEIDILVGFGVGGGLLLLISTPLLLGFGENKHGATSYQESMGIAIVVYSVLTLFLLLFMLK